MQLDQLYKHDMEYNEKDDDPLKDAMDQYLEIFPWHRLYDLVLHLSQMVETH
jgi:hypothetical protein